MKLCGSLLSAVVLSLHVMGINSDDAAPLQTEQSLNAAVEGVNSFSKLLYKELSSMPGNLVVSPFSVEAVVAMLYLGLRGETASSVSTALHLPNNHSLVQQGFQSLFSTLQNTENVTLEIANKIYVEKTFRIKDEFRQSTATYFQSDAEEVDIKDDAENVRIAVNNWAAEKTHDKIKDLLPPGTLTPDVIMILLNAIYFKGLWKTPFDKERTLDRNFYLASGGSKNVPMMHLDTELLYAELHEENMRVLKLPYQGGKFSMLFLLPESNDGLQQLESNIDNLDVPRILSSLREIQTSVLLPRFKILNTIDLEIPLQHLGLQELFRVGADFSGVTDSDVSISKALQKAYIEVNEEGTEAAAVTVLITTLSEVVGLPHGVFIADHPFMYMIIEEALLIAPYSLVSGPPHGVFIADHPFMYMIIEEALLIATYSLVVGPPHGVFIADHPFMYMIIEEGKGTILFIGRVTEPME